MRTALTAHEVTVLRSPIQWSHLYVAAHRPQTLFSARLTAPTTWPAATLAFTSGTPTSGAVPAGATVWIGSAAGARDKGVLRLRSALTKAASGSLSIAELGEKYFGLADNDYLTVVEDYRPAAKFPRYSSAWYMDYDVAYGAGTTIENDNYGPLARLGPAAVGFLIGGHCHLKYVGERSAAYSPSNTIDTWAWAFPNSTTSSSQGTTASPVDVDYTSAIPAGQYHSLTVTEDTTNKTHTGRRLTFVFERTGANAPYDAAVVGNIAGGPQQGGYTANLRILNTTADQSSFPTGAHVVIFTEDHFATEAGEYFRLSGATGTFTVARVVTGATSAATGTIAALLSTTFMQIKTTAGEFIPGEAITEATSGYTATIDCPNIGGNYPYRGNVVVEGWIVSEVVRKNPETGEIEFTVATLDAMLKTIEGYPVALTNRSAATDTISWEDFKRTTMNTATLHCVLWRSTIADIADVEFQAYGPPNTAIMKYVNMDKVSLFDQLNGYWQRTILGWVTCDMQGALYCEMDAVIDETIRAQVVSIWTVDKDQDLRDNLEIQPVTIDPNSQTVLYAVAYRKPLGARSPGDPHGYHGVTREIPEGIAGPLIGGDTAQPDTATLAVWAGNVRAKANNPYPNVPHQLAGNWRIDPVPQCYFVESFVAGDTLRGFALTLQKWIPRALRLAFNVKSWSLLSELTADAETIGLGGSVIVFGDVQPPETPPETPITPPTPLIPPPIVPPATADETWMLVQGGTAGAKILWSKDFSFTGASQPSWNVLSLPASSTIEEMKISLSGMALYVRGTDGANGNRQAIWKCGNFTAVRTTPATAPTWTDILHAGEAIGSTGHTVASGGIGSLETTGENLYLDVKESSLDYHYYSVYSGTAWLYEVVGARFIGFTSVRKNAGLYTPAGNNNNSLRDKDFAFYGSGWSNTGTSCIKFWGLLSGYTHYWVAFNNVATDHLFLRYVVGNADYDTTTDLDRETVNIGGAYNGPYCYVHANAGQLWIASAGGADFTLLETFATGSGGQVLDSALAGGGPLVRAQNVTPTSNTVIFVNPTRVAGAWIGVNGDIDTVYPRTGNLTVVDIGLVFP